MIGKAIGAAFMVALAVPAAAQQVSGTIVGNDPQETGAVPQDESGKAIDRGGLSSRGGTAVETGHTFGETIGTSIYTPIGTSLFTPVQRPPASAAPQS